MKTPVFEKRDPMTGRDRPGRVRRCRADVLCARSGRAGRPTVRKALALTAAAGVLLGVGQAMPAAAVAHAPYRPGVPAGDQPPVTPQGRTAPLRGSAEVPTAAPRTTRAQIISRAKKWITAKVPYSMYDYWSDGYRQDCSGYVSMAWNLGSNEWTGSLDKFGVRISKEQLQPGDMLLFHNTANPEKGSHVVLFAGWTDSTHRFYTAYEETPPRARRQSTPYAYWSNSGRYVPYRYKNVVDSKSALPDLFASVPGYPGLEMFRQGADSPYVTRLGRQLISKGFGTHYTAGPGPHWGETDRRNVEAFQRAQGWNGDHADGYPGPETWRRLFS
ncbi:peptidoglycan-binding protein [Streptomyces nodosus]|uniref:peptidoglycan-binding protein n=1 Tax=Streptomyces nodosus TaxID=40318 RepID=UPI003454F911